MGAGNGASAAPPVRRCQTSAISNDVWVGLVEGLFSKTFRSGVQPVELAKRLIKEMDAGRTVGVNEVWAPNRFVFSLSAEDHERLAHAESAIASELRGGHARERERARMGARRTAGGRVRDRRAHEEG